jgi:hypothetical protein
MDKIGKYFLGRIFDPEKGEMSDQSLLYDQDDLTTHALVVGMTGSGKTGLCIDMLEEAALNGIPALLIDPKGDITNELLHFPDLAPQDFQPWINIDQARREGKSVEQAAEDTANLWRDGLTKWGIGSDRIRALKDSAQFAVYTPGSDAGIPISILTSLEAPEIPWEENRELLLEKISSTVTAILGLVGLEDIDPVRSREHILLANIFENAWSLGRDLNLGELILQTQNPPFKQLGVFDVNTFFPEKDRFELAMLLNNILAAPTFQTWIEGYPLNVAKLLYTPDGRPRHSIFYIAHLPDDERMFFITLLYSAVETWMRTQKGSTTLRAILYFDEIFGYMPPVKNPPSKEVMLRMLKQARAFGVAQVLVTQNPADVDYKGLTNAGTWFIGKLQADQDKQRLLDGLESAMAGGLNRSEYDRLISTLGKRVFLLHNVHEKQPQLFGTRWAMNYLAGPLTRSQIPQLNQLAGVDAQAAAETQATPAETPEVVSGEAEGVSPVTTTEMADLGSSTRPAVPRGINEYFLPNNLTLSQAAKSSKRTLSAETQELGLLYRPVLLAQADIRYLQRKYNLDYDERLTVMVIEPDRRGMVRWEDFPAPEVDARQLERQPVMRASFASLDAPLNDSKIIKALESDFQDWVYRTSQVTVRSNDTLQVYAGPETSQSEFRTLCADAAREKRDDERDKVQKSYDQKISSIKDKLARETRELKEDEAEHSQRKMEEAGTLAELGLSLLGKRRRSVSSSLTKRRMTAQAKADVEESLEAIEQYKRQLAALEKEMAEALEEVDRKWSEIVDDDTEIPVTPYKKDILVDLFGVAWVPYYVVETEGRKLELPGYSNESE